MVVRWASLPPTCQGRAVCRWFLPLALALLAVSVEGQGEMSPTIEGPDGQELDPPDEVIDDLYGGGDLGEMEPVEQVQQERAMGMKNRVMIQTLEAARTPPTPPPPVMGVNSYTNAWGATVPIIPDQTVDDNGNVVGGVPGNPGPYGQASMLQQGPPQADIPDPDIPGGMNRGGFAQAAMLQQGMNIPEPGMPYGPMPNGASMFQQGVAPVKGNTPEAIPNVLNYELQEPTPPPPPLGGVYCRGGACQYRNPPPPLLGVIIKPFPQIIFPNNRREFCHGLSCIPKLGWPPKYDAGFADLCTRLFEYHGGGYFTGLEDKNGIKTLDDLKQAVIHWCKLRTAGDEHGNCPAYGDVFVAANVNLIDKPTISNSRQVCNNLHFFMGMMKGAEANLKLRKELLPDGFSLLDTPPTGINRFGGGGVGPNSLHGREWRKVLQKRGYQFPSTPVPDIAMVQTDKPLPGAPTVSLIKVKDETHEELACRTHQAAAFLQETGYGSQHGAPVPAWQPKTYAQAPAAAPGSSDPVNPQQVSFAQANAQAPAPSGDSQIGDPVSTGGPPASGWPIPPKYQAPSSRKPPMEALEEISAGIAETTEDTDADGQNAYGAATMPGPPASGSDPDEGRALNDQAPSDAGVLKPFGAHTFQSAPQPLQSFATGQQPAQPSPMAFQQNTPGAGASVEDVKADMQASDLMPSAGGDPDESGPLTDDPSSPPGFLQKNAVSKTKKEGEKVPDFTNYPQWDPLYRSGSRPKYNQHFPCRLGINKPNQRDVKYQILPPVPWPINLPPVEIEGNMLQFCSSEFSEIMAGFPQTADRIVEMVGSWCGWQASMTSWVGRAQELGHPEWNFRTCGGLQYFVALFLRNELGTPDARPPGFVCTKFFLGMPAMYRVEALIKGAWGGPGARSLDATKMSKGGGGGGVDKELLRAMQEYAEGLFKQMRGQRDAFLDLNGAKMDEGAFKQPPTGAPPPMAAPALPDSADFPVLLQRMVMNRTRESWHHPSPGEAPPKLEKRQSFLGEVFNIGHAWGHQTTK